MIVLSILTSILTSIFMSDNADFFKTANKETNAGATWHYVGKQPLDPTAKSIPLQMPNEDPYIIFKLKKEN